MSQCSSKVFRYYTPRHAVASYAVAHHQQAIAIDCMQQHGTQDGAVLKVDEFCFAMDGF